MTKFSYCFQAILYLFLFFCMLYDIFTGAPKERVVITMAATAFAGQSMNRARINLLIEENKLK